MKKGDKKESLKNVLEDMGVDLGTVKEEPKETPVVNQEVEKDEEVAPVDVNQVTPVAYTIDVEEDTKEVVSEAVSLNGVKTQEHLEAESRLRSALYDDMEETQKEYTEEEKEIMNMSTTNLVASILANPDIQQFKLTLPVNRIKEYASQVMNNNLPASTVEVYSHNINYLDFFNRFVNRCRDLTPEQRTEISLEYYPSKRSSADPNRDVFVNELLVAKVPEKLVKLEKSNEYTVQGLYFESREKDITRFTQKHKEIFGSRLFQPSITVLDRTNNETYYECYICTLSVILSYLDLTADFLKERRWEIGIGQDRQESTNVHVEPELLYVIQFTRV